MITPCLIMPSYLMALIPSPAYPSKYWSSQVPNPLI